MGGLGVKRGNARTHTHLVYREGGKVHEANEGRGRETLGDEGGCWVVGESQEIRKRRH